MTGFAPLLSIRNLSIRFGAGSRWSCPVDGVSLDIAPGEVLALVGESGSGKSITALSMTGLLPEGTSEVAADVMTFDGVSLLGDRLRGQALRGREIAYIFQDPLGSLNPVVRVGRQIEEAVRLHAPGAIPREEAYGLLRRVGLEPAEQIARAYPHELSGGMQQRVMMAMALAGKPRLLIADEPTTALDVTVQAKVMSLLGSLQQDLGMAILLITHNLGLAAGFAGRIAVMYAGRIVEVGPVEDVLTAPRHPYTQALLQAVPRLGDGRRRREGIPGRVPHPSCYPSGCRFHPRCSRATQQCHDQTPPLQTFGAGHHGTCHHPVEHAHA